MSCSVANWVLIYDLGPDTDPFPKWGPYLGCHPKKYLDRSIVPNFSDTPTIGTVGEQAEAELKCSA